MKIKKTVVVYKCDECGKEFHEPENIFTVYLGGNNDVSHEALIDVTSSMSYGHTHVESTLCRECSIGMIQKLVDNGYKNG